MTSAIALSCGLNAVQQWLKYINFMQFHDPPSFEQDKDVVITEDFSALENKLGYKFKNLKLLSQAFTHSSCFTYEKTEMYWNKEEKLLKGTAESYQKLEYLGNATADFMVAKYLYEKYPHANPCMLHKLRICCTSNQLFCVIAIDLGLDNYLKSSKKLHNQIDVYKSCLMALRNSIANDTNHVDLDELDHCFVKVLSDIFEAVIGEILYELQDYDQVENIFLPILIPYFDIYATPKTFTEHPKCLIFEAVVHEKNHLKNIKWKKMHKEDRKGFNIIIYKGWLADTLIAEGKFKFDNCIAEKKFFKKMHENLEEILNEYHNRNILLIVL